MMIMTMDGDNDGEPPSSVLRRKINVQRRPKIWLYRDKEANEPKGDATLTYEDPRAAVAAVEWFNNKDFHGNIIGVYTVESESNDDHM